VPILGLLWGSCHCSYQHVDFENDEVASIPDVLPIGHLSVMEKERVFVRSVEVFVPKSVCKKGHHIVIRRQKGIVCWPSSARIDISVWLLATWKPAQYWLFGWCDETAFSDATIRPNPLLWICIRRGRWKDDRLPGLRARISPTHSLGLLTT
jgi:hypothetical protein